MEWDTFVENFKIFWNQPVPIIGFTVGTIIIGALFIVGKTSIGKKALNKIKDINNGLIKKNEELISKCEEYKEELDLAEAEFRSFAESKDIEIKLLTDEYELKLTNYKTQLLKQEEMLKVVCENSVNKKIKEAYDKYIPEELDLPVGELKTQIEERVKSEYEDRIAKLEELVYGKREETTND